MVTNTGEIALPLVLTDLLTNQDSQTIDTLDLEFVGLSTPTIYNIPKNYIKKDPLDLIILPTVIVIGIKQVLINHSILIT